MVINRTFWEDKIDALWKEKNLIWIAGVRRSGKTTLCKNLRLPIYDCELGSVRLQLEDPETFFTNMKSPVIALDEIHKLPDPSNVLKIATDHFPKIKIIATGSSSIQALNKFKDSLTDRKRILFFTPMNSVDLKDFGLSLNERMIKGGLPPAILSERFNENFYQDWIDSFWAKDIQELFKVEKRHGFIKFFELLALQSGDLFEATRFSSECEVSRPTIQKYLDILELSFIAYRLRPFHKNSGKEVVAAPKVYFFDTGFISYFRGISQLSSELKGHYWKNLVLNELLSFYHPDSIYYWRDKNQTEIDFILKLRGRDPVTIECKLQAKSFATNRVESFRKIHNGNENWCIATDIKDSYSKDINGHQIRFLNIHHLKDLVK